MPQQIDYAFISRLEGGSRTTGYVPAPSISQSGVTVATGFDLGQRSEQDLRALGLSTTVILKLKPYLGLKKNEALAAVTRNPLVITADETSAIDQAVKADHVRRLSNAYSRSPDNKNKVSFAELPAEAQTVIASVSFQYGTNLELRTPAFWKAVTAQDWAAAIATLNGFGDHYPTRRHQEGALLQRIVE